MDVLLPFAAAVLSLRLAAGSRAPLARAPRARAPRLGALARLVRRRLGRAGLGGGGRLGRPRLPRLLPLRRAAHGRAARRRLAASRGSAPRRAGGACSTRVSRSALALAMTDRPGDRAGTRSPTRPSISSSSRRGSSPSSGTSAARSPPSAVAVRGLRRRPLGNALIVGGVVAAAVGSAAAGLGARRRLRLHGARRGDCSTRLRRTAVVLGGLLAHLGDAARAVEPTAPLAKPEPAEPGDENREHAELDREREPLGVVGDQPRESTHSPPTV